METNIWLSVFCKAWCSSSPRDSSFPTNILLSLSMQCVCVCVCVCDTSSFHISISTAISHDLWLYLPKCAMLGCSHVVGLSGCSEACKASSGEVLLK